MCKRRKGVIEALESRLALRSRLPRFELRGRHGMNGGGWCAVICAGLLGAVFTEMPHTVLESSGAVEEMC